MGKLNLNIIKQKKAAAAKKQKPKVPEPLKRAEQEKNQLQKKIVNKGYARKGDRVATIRPAVPGKSGKNIHGESIPVKSVFIPTLTA